MGSAVSIIAQPIIRRIGGRKSMAVAAAPSPIHTENDATVLNNVESVSGSHRSNQFTSSRNLSSSPQISPVFRNSVEGMNDRHSPTRTNGSLSARSENSESAANAEMFAHTALSLGMDNDDLLFNMMYFSENGGTFGTVMNSIQQETLALHSADNTPYKLKPASESAIAQLPREVFPGPDPASLGGAGRYEELECAVCRDEIEVGSEILRIPHCSHYFHEECLTRWIKLQGWCPICRCNIVDLAANSDPRLTGNTNPNSTVVSIMEEDPMSYQLQNSIQEELLHEGEDTNIIGNTKKKVETDLIESKNSSGKEYFQDDKNLYTHKSFADSKTDDGGTGVEVKDFEDKNLMFQFNAVEDDLSLNNNTNVDNTNLEVSSLSERVRKLSRQYEQEVNVERELASNSTTQYITSGLNNALTRS